MDFDLLRKRSVGTALIAIGHAGWGQIVRANHALAELLASTPEALVGTLLGDHVHPADQTTVVDAFAQLVGDPRRSYEGRWRMIAADGTLRSVSVHASVIAVGDSQTVLVRMAAAHS